MRSSEQGSGGDASEGLAYYWWRSIAEETPKGDDTSAHGRVVSELERLAASGTDSLDELRHRLLSYKAGDLWFPTGGISKEEMDMPPIITILLVGLAGSGKTSLVDLMYCVLGRVGLDHFTSPADKEGRTVCLEEHNVLRSVGNGFCVFDSRGFDCCRMADGLEEVAEWMRNGVRHRQPCHGAGDDSTSAGFHAVHRFARRRVNFTVVVADLYDLHQSLLSGDTRPLDATGELLHFPPIRNTAKDSPLLVLTHGDKLSPEERMEARGKVCAYLGVSEAKGAYDISCLNEYGAAVDEMDPATSYAVCEVLFRAVAAADRCHRPKIRVEDWLLPVFSWLMCGLAVIFEFLASCCAKIGKHKW